MNIASYLRQAAAFLVVVTALVVPSQIVAAQSKVETNPFGGVPCTSTGKESAVCKTNLTEDPITGSNGAIFTAVRILSVIAGVAAVIIIVLGGIRYITSSGDASQISQAKNTIIFAIVGLIVILVAQPIINLILSRI